jgi:hypothetical protein
MRGQRLMGRFDGKSGLDGEGEHGFVVKAQLDAVVIRAERDLHGGDGLALELFEALEDAPGITETQQGERWVSGFDGGFGWGVGAAARALRPRDGVFTLNISHVCLLPQADLVRARSVLVTPDVARYSPNTRKARVLGGPLWGINDWQTANWQ